MASKIPSVLNRALFGALFLTFLLLHPSPAKAVDCCISAGWIEFSTGNWIICRTDPETCYAACFTTVRRYLYNEQPPPCYNNWIIYWEVWNNCTEVDPDCPCDPRMMPPPHEEKWGPCIEPP